MFIQKCLFPDFFRARIINKVWKKKELKSKKKKVKYCEVLKFVVPLHPQTRNEPPHKGGQA